MAHRKLVHEFEKTLVRTSNLEQPGTVYSFEPRTLLLCNDSICVVKVELEAPMSSQATIGRNQSLGGLTIKKSPTFDRKSPTMGRAQSEKHLPIAASSGVAAASGAVSGPGAGQERFVVIDLLLFSEGQFSVEDSQDPEQFSFVNRKANKVLHTVKIANKKEMLEEIQKTVAKWRADALVQQKEEAVTQQLQGLTFSITGAVPVAPPVGKPYLVYIVSSHNK